MKVLEENTPIVAKLLAQGESYLMLDIMPHKHNELPFLLREHAFQFLVVVKGFAQPIIVSRNSFVIIPLLAPMNMLVKYYQEDKEDEKEKSERDARLVRPFQPIKF